MPKPKLLSASFAFLCALLVQLAAYSLSAPRVLAEPPKAEVDPAARSAFEAGAEAYDHGRFGDALREFERAYQLSPHPKLLFNIGRAADGDGQSERAISAYQSYLLAFPRAENHEFVESRIAKLKSAPSAASATAAPTSAPFVGLAPASVAAADVATSARGAPASPEPAAPSGQPPVWKRAWFWSAVGAVAAVVVTTIVVVAVKHDHNRDSGPAVNEHVLTLEKR